MFEVLLANVRLCRTHQHNTFCRSELTTNQRETRTKPNLFRNNARQHALARCLTRYHAHQLRDGIRLRLGCTFRLHFFRVILN